MKFLNILFSALGTLIFANFGLSAESHDHKSHQKEERPGHAEEHKHAEEKQEGEHEGHEESAVAGPEKGILSASEEKGFQLSPEAIKTFALETKVLQGAGPWALPLSAKLLAGEEINVFRLRGGFYKRVDFQAVKRSGSEFTLSSPELKPGDSVVTSGIGFLRIAEIAAFGGAPEGHSH